MLVWELQLHAGSIDIDPVGCGDGRSKRGTGAAEQYVAGEGELGK